MFGSPVYAPNEFTGLVRLLRYGYVRLVTFQVTNGNNLTYNTNSQTHKKRSKDFTFRPN